MTENVPFNYAGLTPEHTDYQKSKVVVLPIPFEDSTTWQTGTKAGPGALIDASRNMELYDIETKSYVYKQGIHTLEPIKSANAQEMIEEAHERVAKEIDAGKFVVSIGGEHTVSIGPIKAFSEKVKDLSILYLDAHADHRDQWEDSKYNHACVVSRVKEFNPNIISVGIRSVGQEEVSAVKEDKTYFAENIYNNNDWMDEAISKLSDNIYISIDLDVFDISILPGTGTPEPGGLGWYQTTNFLRKVIEQKNLVGFDVVELRPIEADKSSDFLAAKLIYKLLSYEFVENK